MAGRSLGKETVTLSFILGNIEPGQFGDANDFQAKRLGLAKKNNTDALYGVEMKYQRGKLNPGTVF